MMKSTTLLAALFLAAAANVHAQTALEQLSREAGVDAAPLAAQLKAVRALDAGAPAAVRSQKDVLSACSELEAKPFMAWNVKQAAIMVQTCLNHAYPADGDYLVQAQPARFAVRLCPAQADKLSCSALVEVDGIKITVSGAIVSGDPVLNDLDSALQKRGRKLMGFNAVVENQAQVRN